MATDAVVVVASGDKHWFLTPQDLFEQSDDDVHVKPREERALTQAIRSVLGGERREALLHGRPRRAVARPGARRARGPRRAARPAREEQLRARERRHHGAGRPRALRRDARSPSIAGPCARRSRRRRRTACARGCSQGGSLSRRWARSTRRRRRAWPRPGLDDVLAPFGIALDDDLVHDVEPERRHPRHARRGVLRLGAPAPGHATLVGRRRRRPSRRASPRSSRARCGTWPRPARRRRADLLVTSDAAFAKREHRGRRRSGPTLRRATPADRAGPFVVAMASERPRIGPSAPHGPRVVVVGSRFFLAEDNWRQPRPLHGAAFLVDSALSWLAARPRGRRRARPRRGGGGDAHLGGGPRRGASATCSSSCRSRRCCSGASVWALAAVVGEQAVRAPRGTKEPTA